MRSGRLISIVICLMVLASLLTITGAVANVEDVSTYILVFKEGTPKDEMVRTVTSLGGDVVNVLEDVYIVIARASNPSFAVRARSLATITDVSVDIKLGLMDPLSTVVVPSNVDYEEAPYYYMYGWNIRVIDADDAWEITEGSEKVEVAVLDTGVDFTHPDLEESYDVKHSISFVDPELEMNFLNISDPEDYMPTMDYYGHGTHVAGIIAASGMVLGVAPEVRIVNVKVLAADGTGYLSWIIQGIYYVAKEKFDIASMSFGGYLDLSNPYHLAAYLALYRVIKYAHNRGVTLVAAAGNESLDLDAIKPWVIIPAEMPYVIAVSAVGPVFPPPWPEEAPELPLNAIDVAFASYSNYGTSIDLAAPGGDFTRYNATGWYLDMVLSTWSAYSWWLPARYVFAAGTSMATPHVSGVAALVLSVDHKLKPEGVASILYTTAIDKGDPGFDKMFGHGLVNAYRAVLLASELGHEQKPKHGHEKD